VDDLVEGIYRLLLSDEHFPVNIGNPHETSILEFAQIINLITGNQAGVTFLPALRLGDDPQRRQPDISRAKSILNWEPYTSLENGLLRTIPYFKDMLSL
jgi:dTDP-glucose 4,6-dehydratase